MKLLFTSKYPCKSSSVVQIRENKEQKNWQYGVFVFHISPHSAWIQKLTFSEAHSVPSQRSKKEHFREKAVNCFPKKLHFN